MIGLVAARRVRAAISVGVAPVNLVPPAISGAPTIGQPLTCSPGLWSGAPYPSFAYQWLRDSVEILGATESEYELTATESGTDVSCRVLATNLAGSVAAASDSITIPDFPANILTAGGEPMTAGGDWLTAGG